MREGSQTSKPAHRFGSITFFLIASLLLQFGTNAIIMAMGAPDWAILVVVLAFVVPVIGILKGLAGWKALKREDRLAFYCLIAVLLISASFFLL